MVADTSIKFALLRRGFSSSSNCKNSTGLSQVKKSHYIYKTTTFPEHLIEFDQGSPSETRNCPFPSALPSSIPHLKTSCIKDHALPNQLCACQRGSSNLNAAHVTLIHPAQFNQETKQDYTCKASFTLGGCPKVQKDSNATSLWPYIKKVFKKSFCAW